MKAKDRRGGGIHRSGCANSPSSFWAGDLSSILSEPPLQSTWLLSAGVNVAWVGSSCAAVAGIPPVPKALRGRCRVTTLDAHLQHATKRPQQRNLWRVLLRTRKHIPATACATAIGRGANSCAKNRPIYMRWICRLSFYVDVFLYAGGDVCLFVCLFVCSHSSTDGLLLNLRAERSLER